MSITTLHGDCREMLQTLPAGSVQCVVTSPPYYGLRRYSDDPREIGQEATPGAYVAALVEVFRQVRRVLRDDGCIWLNLGDSYVSHKPRSGAQHTYADVQQSAAFEAAQSAVDLRGSGYKDKDLLGIPWRVAFALQDDGWYLRSDIIWNKPNCMPESVTDRPTRAHEYVFLLTKQARYFYDADAIREPQSDNSHGGRGVTENWKTAKLQNIQSSTLGRQASEYNPAGRNRRTVWTISTQPYSGAPDCEACNGTGVDWNAFQRSFGVRRTDTEHKAWCKANPCPVCNGTGKDDGDHYAVMPEALIAPCILAGSSAQACEHCGAAWGRVVERESNWQDRKAAGGTAGNVGTSESYQNGVHGKNMSHDLGPKAVRDLGFAPRCPCPDNTGSARSVVLDPFGGSGTVGKVAMRYQRDAVLIELNQAYIDDHIETRTDGVQVELFV